MLDLDGDSSTTDMVDLHYHENSLGSIAALTKSDGAVVESYRYDPFGKVTVYDSGGSPVSTTQVQQPYMFTGRALDWEEGSGLYYYRLRYYDPESGRFVSRDPLGLWGDESQNGNGQSYCGNNPVNRVDPMGLDDRDDIDRKQDDLDRRIRDAFGGPKKLEPRVDWPDDFIGQTTYPTDPSPLPLPFGLGSAVHEGAQEALEDGLAELGDGNEDGSLNSDDWKSAAQAALQALLKRLWKDWAYPSVRRELDDAFCWAGELEWYEFLYPTTWWRAFVSFFVDFYWNPVIREAGGAAALGYVWNMYDRYQQKKSLKLRIGPCELEYDPKDSGNRWYFEFEFEFKF